MDGALWGNYHCGLCLRWLPRSSPDVAEAEHRRLFGYGPEDVIGGAAEVCDDCWRALMAWRRSLSPEDRADMERRFRRPPGAG